MVSEYTEMGKRSRMGTVGESECGLIASLCGLIEMLLQVD